MRKSNYDKYPSTSVNGSLWEGWDAILNQIKMDLPLQNGRHVLVVECYQGVHHKELLEQLALLPVDERVDTRDLFGQGAAGEGGDIKLNIARGQFHPGRSAFLSKP